jgi:hypothetical protein
MGTGGDVDTGGTETTIDQSAPQFNGLPKSILEPIERQILQRWVRRRLRPRVFAGHTEHRRHRVVAERHKGPLVLPARAGNVHVAMNQTVGWNCSASHFGRPWVLK